MPMHCFTCLFNHWLWLGKKNFNNAPEVVTSWLGDYFDFTNDQNTLLKVALIRIHDSHRNHELPEDIATLQRLKLALSENSISSSQACAQQKGIVGLLKSH